MATQNRSYDDPIYAARLTFGGNLTGSGGVTAIAAFTNMLVKSYSIKPTTAGTSNDTVIAYLVSGTTTSTHALATFGSAATSGTNIAGTFTMTASTDALRIVKGTDATGVMAVGVELQVIPGASITT